MVLVSAEYISEIVFDNKLGRDSYLCSLPVVKYLSENSIKLTRPVTFFVGVPPMFERIAKGALETGTDISTIRFAVSGAMPLSEKVAHLWQSASHGIILEGYGLSETSPVISGSPLSNNRRLGTLGLPFPSTQVRLVDLDDPTKDVKEGVRGEILVKGPQVFSGYLNAPEETARAFTEDGWFRTGDVAINDDGYLYMEDRIKELILSGGFNVYPSQVEEVMRLYPGVRDVAVVGYPVDDSREVVAAALVMDEGATLPTLEQVREWAGEKLSAYAIPRKLEEISELPRNQLGKVLRRSVKEQLLDPMSRAWESTTKAVTEFVTDGPYKGSDDPAANVESADTLGEAQPDHAPADPPAPDSEEAPEAK